MNKYILAFDAGTTSCRAILYNEQMDRVSTAQREFPQYYPKLGWVEQDGMEIWGTMIGVAQEALGQSGIKAESIHAIGMTNQRETTLLWNRQTGKPIHPAIVWQCGRSRKICEEWKTQGLEDLIRQKTGLTLDAYFSASKIRWLLDHVPEANTLLETDDLCFGTIDTWLLWNLTGGKVHATDYSNASRTMLFNIHQRCWDEKLLDIFGIPASLLPQVYPSNHHFGDTNPSWFGGISIPIHGILGDQQASLYGHCCFEPGSIKNTYGTGCFLLMNTGDHPIMSRNGLITTIAWGEDDHICYALEGSVFVGGAAVQWLRDELRIIEKASDTESICYATSADHGLTVIPAFTGLGAPYWDRQAQGAILGITRGTTREDIIRATVESIAYQVADVVGAMKADSHISLKTFKVDGGASLNRFLMQFQADIMQTPVLRSHSVEMTAFGAALMTAKATGFPADISDKENASTLFMPNLAPIVAEAKYQAWIRAVHVILGTTYYQT